MALSDIWNELKNWAGVEFAKAEASVEGFINTELPVLEADVENALLKYGPMVMADLVAALSGGLASGEAIGTAAASLIMLAEKQGEQVLQETARTAGGQLVAAAQVKLGELLGAQPAGAAAQS